MEEGGGVRPILYQEIQKHRECSRQGSVGNLLGKEAEPAGTVQEFLARLSEECARRHAFRSDTPCLFAWCQAERKVEFFIENSGDGAGTDNGASALVEASKRASKIGGPAGTGLPFPRRWGCQHLRLPSLRTCSV